MRSTRAVRRTDDRRFVRVRSAKIRIYTPNFLGAYFWATHSGAELDLLVIRGGKRWGFEFKFAEAPRATRSMHSAREALGLQHLWVVYPGEDVFPLQPNMTAVGLTALPRELASVPD